MAGWVRCLQLEYNVAMIDNCDQSRLERIAIVSVETTAGKSSDQHATKRLRTVDGIDDIAGGQRRRLLRATDRVRAELTVNKTAISQRNVRERTGRDGHLFNLIEAELADDIGQRERLIWHLCVAPLES